MESFTKIDVLEQATAELNHLKFNVSRCRSDISVNQHTVCIISLWIHLHNISYYFHIIMLLSIKLKVNHNFFKEIAVYKLFY